MTIAYHTALSHGQLEEAPACTYAEANGSVAMQHNIWDDLPPDFNACDVMFCEPPWRAGYDIFNERAGFQDPPWSEFMKRINTVINNVQVPIVVTAGKAALRYLTGYTATYPTSLNGASAYLVAWNLELSDTESAETAVQEVCRRFNVIGDWCCGYGRTAVYAKREGKRFVMSDHNAQCIGYIAENIL